MPGQIVICLCVYYFIYEFNQLFNAYKDAAGIWHRDRFRTLTTAGVNLVLNLLLVKPMGLYGVILSTVVATVIVGMPWLIHNLFTTLFDGEDRQSYLGTLVFYGSVTFLNCMLTDRVCSQIPVEGIQGIIGAGTGMSACVQRHFSVVLRRPEGFPGPVGNGEEISA